MQFDDLEQLLLNLSAAMLPPAAHELLSQFIGKAQVITPESNETMAVIALSPVGEPLL